MRAAGAGPLGDLDRRRDIHDLVVRFYRGGRVRRPARAGVRRGGRGRLVGPHPQARRLLVRVLLGEPGYDGAILGAHRRVHELSAFRVEHFDHWYPLWVESVDAGWAGPMAEKAKRHAARIATSSPGGPRHGLAAARGRPATVRRHRRRGATR